MIKTLRLILGDQLHGGHSWYTTIRADVIYLMAELRQETDYVTHHIQKVVAFFASMRKFAESLQAQGHNVRYFSINDPDNPQELPALIRKLIREEGIGRFEYQWPDEYRLDAELRELCNTLEIPCEAYDTEHFYTSRQELSAFFHGKKQLLMENFYRMMRKKHGVLMAGEHPLGGQWNYDAENRKKWKGTPAVPPLHRFDHDVTRLISEIRQAGVQTLGNIAPDKFNWALTLMEARTLLDVFCRELLPFFGDYQDAMHTDQRFLFHSRLSFALNCKLITPREVVQTVEDFYHQHKGEIHISQAEGFIRQILGWREYTRGIYWKEMPDYAEMNFLENRQPLPEFFWTGNTRMNCLKHAIGQSLEEAYAHHIQRLMITGNYALLAQTDPDEVDRWYLGIYADALQWVQLPNTRGMSQYADGGVMATKPYVSSANYINKMGNYCQGCYYNPREKTGEQACPFNALYWNFLDAKRHLLSNNPRMGMMYRLLDKKDPKELQALQERAADIIAHPDRY
jgi:deoxyribodipyrimidine photolyase-related protein